MRKFLSGFAAISSQARTESLSAVDSCSDSVQEDISENAQVHELPPHEVIPHPSPEEMEADIFNHTENHSDDPAKYSDSSLIERHRQDAIDFDDLNGSSVLDSVQKSLASGTATSPAKPVARPEIIRGAGDNLVTLKFDIETVKRNCQKLSSVRVAEKSIAMRDNVDDLEDAGLCNTENETRAAEVLSRIIKKTDFTEMEAVGQFNLGFIIARRRKSGAADHVIDDLFIVDQHAADEKYNFETLQQTTTIQSQKLFR
jgi:DNA mismatch repair protein PMS2